MSKNETDARNLAWGTANNPYPRGSSALLAAADSSIKMRRFLRVRAVLDRTGLKPSTLYAAMAEGTFPRSVPLGPRVRAWLEDEVTAWMDARIAARDGYAK